MKFAELGLDEQLLEGIGYMGFEETTPVQAMAIPIILEGKDILACAQTGTGKTGAFVIPVLHLLAKNPGKGIRALIICPTRELAVQIDQQINALSYFVSVDSVPIYGGGDGADWDEQKKALVKGTEIIVATPGKLISHMKLGYVDYSNLEFFILDEADRMLDMGFYDDIMGIEKLLPKKRQNLLFSATMPPKITKMAKSLLSDDHGEIKLAISKPAAGVLQAAYLAYDSQKIQLVVHLIKDKPNYESILIFSSTKKNVGEIVRALKRQKINAAGISSDFEQSEREQILLKFRSRSVRVLVATDVMARGIDIKEINLVINFDVPRNAEDYVHRVGRTARASTTGVALTLINEKDMADFKTIEDLIEREIPKLQPPKGLGEGPEWDPNAKRSFHKRSSGGRKSNSKGKRRR
jgi:superfamily II DNA/RNA helicase